MMEFQESMAPRIERGRSWVCIDGKQYSYEKAEQILLEKGLVTKAHRAGRPYCTAHRLSFPEHIWGNISRCPLCGRNLRENPRESIYKDKRGRTYHDLKIE
jgi:uncharacterized protein with PIN domain